MKGLGDFVGGEEELVEGDGGGEDEFGLLGEDGRGT